MREIPSTRHAPRPRPPRPLDASSGRSPSRLSSGPRTAAAPCWSSPAAPTVWTKDGWPSSWASPSAAASPDFVRQHTGYAIGGVAPVGHASPLPIFIDADLLAYDQIWAAAEPRTPSSPPLQRAAAGAHEAARRGRHPPRRRPCGRPTAGLRASISRIISPCPPVIIGIAGGTGSGKTTVANVILERAGAANIAFLPHDAYYKNLAQLPRFRARDDQLRPPRTPSRLRCWSSTSAAARRPAGRDPGLRLHHPRPHRTDRPRRTAADRPGGRHPDLRRAGRCAS